MSTEAVLQIEGMSCAACVRRVERGLQELPGVREAAVNLATGKATIACDPDQVDEEALRRHIEDLGYRVGHVEWKEPLATFRTTLEIGGMSCAACVRRVETILEALPGVARAAVNLATASATIDARPGRVDWE